MLLLKPGPASAVALSAQRPLHLIKASQTFLPKAQRRTCFNTLKNQGRVLLNTLPGSSKLEGLLLPYLASTVTD